MNGKKIRGLLIAVGLLAAVGGAVGLATASEADLQAATGIADQRITAYEAALQTGDPAKIRQATLALQSDPYAIRRVNKVKNDAFKTRLNQELSAIQVETKAKVRQRVAQQYHVPESDVTFFEATNPSTEIKVGQDWDVTVQVQGKDVPLKVSQDIVHESYYEAATGRKASSPEVAREFAHHQAVEVTNYTHPEAYGGGGKRTVNGNTMTEGGEIIAGDKSKPLRDPGQLKDVMEFKSNIARNNAADIHDAAEARIKSEGLTGEAAEAIRAQARADALPSELEQARQYTKQFDRQTKPRVESRGGKISSQVEKGTNILRQVADGEISPGDGRKQLAAMGETPESIIRKGTGLHEAAQKLGDSPSDVIDRAKAGATPKEVMVDNVKDQMHLKKLQEGKQAAADEVADGAKAGDADTTKAGDIDRAKVGDVDGAKVGDMDGGRVPDPNAPKGKLGGVLEAGGQVMAASDILNTGQDIIDYSKGEKTAGEVIENAAVNFTPPGQAYAVGKQIGEKGADYLDAQPAVEKANQAIAQAHATESGLEARRQGASKEDADAVMAALNAGDRGKAEEIAQGLRDRGIDYNLPDAPEEYTTEADDTAWERTKDVGKGIGKQVQRAGTFVVNTGKNLGGLGSDTVSIIGDELHTAREEAKHEDQAEGLYDRLVKQGADPEEARAAVNEFKDGNFVPLRNLRQQAQERNKRPSDDLAQAMLDEADSGPAGGWKEDGYRNIDPATVKIMDDFTGTDSVGRTDEEILSGEKNVITMASDNIITDDWDKISKADAADDFRKDRILIKQQQKDERNTQDAWDQIIRNVNQAIDKHDQAQREILRQKIDEARVLIEKMKNGGMSDAEFTHQLNQLENEGAQLNQQAQQTWTSIIDRLVNDQLNSSGAGISGAGVPGGATGDAVTDILNSVPPDQIDQRTVVCDTQSKSGNNTPASISVDMKGGSGTATLSYSLYSVKDRLLVQVNGGTVSDTGCTNGSNRIPIQVSGGDEVRVIIQPACEGSSTSWNFSVSCPARTLSEIGGTGTVR